MRWPRAAARGVHQNELLGERCLRQDVDPARGARFLASLEAVSRANDAYANPSWRWNALMLVDPEPPRGVRSGRGQSFAARQGCGSLLRSPSRQGARLVGGRRTSGRNRPVRRGSRTRGRADAPHHAGPRVTCRAGSRSTNASVGDSALLRSLRAIAALASVNGWIVSDDGMSTRTRPGAAGVPLSRAER